jgi:hypothetical protein
MSSNLLPIPEPMDESQKMDERTEEELYVESLTEKEHKAYLIAKEHLKSSFNIKKSIGFIKWKNNKE